MRVLITGVAGFAGSHLADLALARGAQVAGMVRPGGRTDNIHHLRGRISLEEADLRDAAAVRRLLEATRPDWLFHLAGQSFVGASWREPGETLATNILGQLHLLEGLRAAGQSPRVLVAGSSDEYGVVLPEELPVRETSPLRPLSPYAVSKVTQDLMGFQYFRGHGLPIVRSRAFNHEGPRRDTRFLAANLACQLAEIEAGRRPPVVQVGDLTPRRDYSDVRDVVRGYWLLLERGEPGEVYNLCSGRARAAGEVLDLLLAEAEVGKIEVRADPDRVRPAEVAVIEGDPGKIARQVGWRVEIPFERTLADMLAEWRRRIRETAP